MHPLQTATWPVPGTHWNLAGLEGVREGFRRWGFPPWFHLLNGTVNLVTGVALIWPPTRGLGLRLSVLICLAIWITLIRHRDLRHLPPSVLLFALTLLAAWGLELI